MSTIKPRPANITIYAPSDKIQEYAVEAVRQFADSFSSGHVEAGMFWESEGVYA